MATLKLYKEKLRHNHAFLSDIFQKNDIEWGVVSKILCGNRLFINELVKLGVREMHDTRISNLRTIKEINPDVQTVYIKPPAQGNVEDIIKYADVSFNTELSTIKTLSDEAVRQGKTHKIIIMIELGDLREGVMGEHLVGFYGKIFELPNIDIVGIGTNLNCLHGVMPSQDKLVILSLYKQLIECTFNKQIPFVSGGTTVTLPLLLKHQLPKSTNHFRIGEALFFGIDLFTNEPIQGMHTNVFRLYAEIIELHKKPKVPIGPLGENPSGDTFKIKEEDYGKSSYRAILDVGLLDVKEEFLECVDPRISIVGSSSDMLVIDLGATDYDYKVGDKIPFNMKYMGALGLLNSDYIEKEVVS